MMMLPGEFPRRACRVLAGVLAATWTAASLAVDPAAVPDAGQTLRELQRPAPAVPVMPFLPQVEIERGGRIPMSELPGFRLVVHAFRITGAKAFAAADLQALLDDFTGRELDFAGLQQAVDRITRHYRDHGHLVSRAYLPEQDVSSGIVEIAVLEARIGKTELRNPARLADARIRTMLDDAGVSDGRPVLAAPLDRALLLLNETPGVRSARAVIKPGAALGQSDVILETEAAPLVSGSVDADNFGYRYTGAYRLGGTLAVNSPLRIGDLLTARLQASNEALLYNRLAYQHPVGGRGVTVAASYTSSRYELGGAFAALGVTGTARALGLDVTYPVIRSAGFNLTASAGIETKDLHDSVATPADESDKTTRPLNIAIAGTGVMFYGIGYGFNAGLTFGDLEIKTPAALAADQAGPGTDGGYAKFNYSLALHKRLALRWSLYGAVVGQLAANNLDSSEKFSLGGANGVRAYPQGEAPGDDGFIVTAEIRWLLLTRSARTMQLAAFMDAGGITINHDPYDASDNGRRLASRGFSVTWSLPKHVMLRAMWAQKAGTEPATAEPDQDSRYWMQLVKTF